MIHPILGGLALALAASLSAPPAGAQERIGVVLLHGKGSAPQRHEILANAITGAGHVVDVPEMCWSRKRIYDRSYLDCLSAIDDAISRLKQKGATAFVVAGHSLGANGALGYGARNRGLKGVIALAPGHRPEAFAKRGEIVASVALAREEIVQGRGNVRTTFADVSTGVTTSVATTPVIYLSFMAPDSPAIMPGNAARLTAPLLYVVGTDDPLQRRGPQEVFGKAPSHPLNRYVTVRAGHFNTSPASVPAVVAWLKEIAKN